MEPRNTDSNRDVLFSSTEDSQQKAHITFTHTIFHAQLCHTHTHTYIHTYIRTYVHTYIHTYVRTYIHIHTYVHAYYLLHMHSFTHSLSPPPLSFLPSPSPLELLKLIIGRSWLVGLSGPLILGAGYGLNRFNVDFGLVQGLFGAGLRGWFKALVKR